MATNRRNEYDVTNKIKVSDTRSVKNAVIQMAEDIYDDVDSDVLSQLFDLFHDLFHGQYKNFKNCDTVYHDIQHSLDVTLCAARHIIGHDKTKSLQLGFNGYLICITTALFHDSGYIREANDDAVNGAAYTKTHVSRSASFITEHTSHIVGKEIAEIAARIVHFTGYEIPYEKIAVKNAQEKLIGTMVASSDILAQMADRCYIEKCRDRLYPEFVLGGMTVGKSKSQDFVIYETAKDMLYKTPEFYHVTTKEKLNKTFNKVYKYLDAFFETGNNPYLESADSNIEYLETAIKNNDLQSLRRRPPKNIALKDFPFEDVYKQEKLLSIQTLTIPSMQAIGHQKSYFNFT